MGGRINFQGHFKREEPKKLCDYDIKIGCLNNRIEFNGLPYQFKELSGNILIQNDLIRLEKLKAATDNISLMPAKSLIKIDGEIKTYDNKFGGAVLRLEANDIALDERLGADTAEKDSISLF